MHCIGLLWHMMKPPNISLFPFHTLNWQITRWTKREMFDSFTKNPEYVTGLFMENELF